MTFRFAQKLDLNNIYICYKNEFAAQALKKLVTSEKCDQKLLMVPLDEVKNSNHLYDPFLGSLGYKLATI